MITKTFIIEEHEEYQTKGARPIDTPHADPLGGMSVAHDMLEHFHNDQGSVYEELMALGASYYVRGETGFFNNG